MSGKAPKKTYQDIVFENNSVTAPSYEYLLDTYHGLKKDIPARRFICSVPKLTHRDADGIVIGYEYLERCAGTVRQRQATIAFLHHIKNTYDPYLQWKQHSFQGKKRRVLTQVGMLDVYQKMLATDPERIYVETGKAVTRRSMQETAREIYTTMEPIRAPYPEGQLIYDYLLNRKFSTYANAAEKNGNNVMTAIAASPNPEAQLRYWGKLCMMPKPFPFYSQKPGSRSTRLYHKWLSSLSGSVRQAWLSFTITMDIKHCQITILARLLGIRSLQEFLESGGDFWTEILTYMGLTLQEKPLIKVAVYSLCYGMGWKNLHTILSEGLAGKKLKRSFFTHPMIKEMLSAIRTCQQAILKNGGMQGAYGWIPLLNGQPNTVLACVAQSFETDLIRIVYEIATRQEEARTETFQVLGHIHDGIMIEPYQNNVIPMLQTAVKERGAYHGMIANLVVESKQEDKQRESDEEVQDLEIWF